MSATNDDAASIYAAEVVRHTAEPWHVGDEHGTTVRSETDRVALMGDGDQAEADAARIVQCVNTCAKFPDPAAALNDLRQLLGQARGLLAEGDTDRADNMLIAALGVLDGEEG